MVGIPANCFKASCGRSARGVENDLPSGCGQKCGAEPAAVILAVIGRVEGPPFTGGNSAGANHPMGSLRQLGAPPGGKNSRFGAGCQSKTVALVSGISYSVAERAQLKKK